MPLFRLSVLWRHEFRQQQHNGRQQSLGAVIEVGVITVLGGVTVRLMMVLARILAYFSALARAAKLDGSALARSM